MEIDTTPEQITQILSRDGWNFVEYTTRQGSGPLIHVVSFVYKGPPSMAKGDGQSREDAYKGVYKDAKVSSGPGGPRELLPWGSHGSVRALSGIRLVIS